MYNVIGQLSDHIERVQGGSKSETGKQEAKSCSKVIAGDYFQQLLRTELPTMSEPNIELITKFAIKGSRRAQTERSANS